MASQKQRDATGAEVLSSLDKLYIVHVWKEGKKEKEKDKDKWCAGGPLLPGMRVALAKFPHHIIELEVTLPFHGLAEFYVDLDGPARILAALFVSSLCTLAMHAGKHGQG